MKILSHNRVIEQVSPDYYQKGVKKNLLQRLWHRNKLREVVKAITIYPKNVLDVGCASGWLLSQFARIFPGAKYFGIDIYEKAIIHGRAIYPQIKFKTADAHKIPYKRETFDLIICTEVLEHVDDPKAVLLEIKRVLRTKGVAIIELDSGSLLFSIVWFLWRKVNGKVWNDSHLHSFDVKKLERMILDCGFTIMKKKKFNFGMAMVFSIHKK